MARKVLCCNLGTWARALACVHIVLCIGFGLVSFVSNGNGGKEIPKAALRGTESILQELLTSLQNLNTTASYPEANVEQRFKDQVRLCRTNASAPPPSESPSDGTDSPGTQQLNAGDGATIAAASGVGSPAKAGDTAPKGTKGKRSRGPRVPVVKRSGGTSSGNKNTNGSDAYCYVKVLIDEIRSVAGLPTTPPAPWTVQDHHTLATASSRSVQLTLIVLTTLCFVGIVFNIFLLVGSMHGLKSYISLWLLHYVPFVLTEFVLIICLAVYVDWSITFALLLLVLNGFTLYVVYGHYEDVGRGIGST